MVWTLRATYELAIRTDLPDPLEFRVDVLAKDDAAHLESTYRLRVWRYETFRLAPLSSVAEGQMFDHACLVLDDMFDNMEVSASSPGEAFDVWRQRALVQFGING